MRFSLFEFWLTTDYLYICILAFTGKRRYVRAKCLFSFELGYLPEYMWKWCIGIEFFGFAWKKITNKKRVVANKN